MTKSVCEMSGAEQIRWAFANVESTRGRSQLRLESALAKASNEMRESGDEGVKTQIHEALNGAVQELIDSCYVNGRIVYGRIKDAVQHFANCCYWSVQGHQEIIAGLNPENFERILRAFWYRPYNEMILPKDSQKNQFHPKIIDLPPTQDLLINIGMAAAGVPALAQVFMAQYAKMHPENRHIIGVRLGYLARRNPRHSYISAETFQKVLDMGMDATEMVNDGNGLYYRPIKTMRPQAAVPEV